MTQTDIELKDDLDPAQFSTLNEMFSASLAANADLPAFTCMGRTISYRELDERAWQFANYLRGQTDLKPGDRIAIQLPNLLQFPVAVIGATRAGLVLVNTNPLYTSREMKHQFKDSGARGIIILANFCDKLQLILKDTDISTVIVTEMGDMLSPVKRILVNAAVRHVKKMVPHYSIPQAVSWKQAMRASAKPREVKSKFLCGHDERAWFVAAIPEDWLHGESAFASLEDHRRAYVDYLLQRLTAPRAGPRVSARQRLCMCRRRAAAARSVAPHARRDPRALRGPPSTLPPGRTDPPGAGGDQALTDGDLAARVHAEHAGRAERRRRAAPSMSVAKVHESVDEIERALRRAFPSVKRVISHAEPPRES